MKNYDELYFIVDRKDGVFVADTQELGSPIAWLTRMDANRTLESWKIFDRFRYNSYSVVKIKVPLATSRSR